MAKHFLETFLNASATDEPATPSAPAQRLYHCIIGSGYTPSGWWQLESPGGAASTLQVPPEIRHSSPACSSTTQRIHSKPSTL